MASGSYPLSWEETAKLYEKRTGEHLSGARVGQIGRAAEAKLRAGVLCDLALMLGIINDEEAEQYRTASEVCHDGGAVETSRGRLGEGDRESLQMLFPFGCGDAGDDASSNENDPH